MEGIQVSLEKVGPSQNIAVIKVGGYIDTTTSAELEHSLSTLLKENSYNIIIDLGNVDYISSAGWGIFISEIKGIRGKSGDLKLVRMVPDVYEVFELLEFHYILKAFDTLEEAIADFDGVGSSGAGSLQSPSAAHQVGNSVSASEPETDIAQVQPGLEAGGESEPQTLEEKLRQVVIEKPDSGLFQLIKALNTPRFGNIKLGWFEMRKYLKQLNLDSKKKRVQFFKQHTFG
ncbi:MAG: STAS domain-containing protein [Calditrichaeota bacterium]|nr:STAS domain-containing protein [candidate division KSB1 bacterium]MCZ6820080.1 STAS domain-containing protein [Calditrichota bacterium]TDI85985.1 MAG: anti-sigma factor antagonist [Caldithrix sp.]